MKKNSYFKKAFSLIELSIVILIIGILVAGVTSSSKLFYKFKLSTVRTLTQSSPTSSIKGLSLWLDATAENAISASESQDGALISNWTDTNPQIVYKKVFSQSSNNAKPTYKENGINGLPAIDFAWSSPYNKFFSRANTFANDFTGHDQATIFLVMIRFPIF